jgi:hypothetical protein
VISRGLELIGNGDGLFEITTRLRDGQPTILFRFPLGARDFSLLQSIHTDAGAPPASYLVGTVGRFLGVQRPGHETDHLMTRLRMP